MSTATAARHTPAELTLVAADHSTGIVEFAAPSRHDAARVNTVSLDTTNGDIRCDCQGAECGRACWHADHIVAAWLASPAMAEVRWLTAAGLVRYGTKHRLCVDTYTRRTGRFLAADALALVAARSEYRLRAARAAAVRALDLPLAA